MYLKFKEIVAAEYKYIYMARSTKYRFMYSNSVNKVAQKFYFLTLGIYICR